MGPAAAWAWARVTGIGYWDRLLGSVTGIGYWLLVTGYWLLVTSYWLLATGYWLLATRVDTAERAMRRRRTVSDGGGIARVPVHPSTLRCALSGDTLPF